MLSLKIKTPNMKRLFALVALMACFTVSAFAQEKIYIKSQKAPLEGTIIEIGVSEIKYRPSDAEQLVMVVEKEDVVKVVFKSGRVQYFADVMQDFTAYKGQRRNIAKVGLLSPVFGYTDFYLEHADKPGRSMEYQLSIIGLGKNIYYDNSYYSPRELFINQRGASIGAGIKFVRVPDFNTGRLKLRHIMQGGYIKPAITVGYYQRDLISYYYDPSIGIDQYNTKRKGIFTSNISISLGKQWILDNTISIEIYGSLGMGFDNFRSSQEKFVKDNGGSSPYVNDENIPYTNFGYTRFGRGDLGLTMAGGLKIGYLFNWKKEAKAAKEYRDRVKIMQQ
jgi:hypothetical protein